MNTQNLNVTQHLATKVCATTVLRPELSSWTTGLSLIKRVVNNYKKLTNYARWKCNKRVWVRIWIEAWFSNMTDRMFRILRASKLNQRADSYRRKNYKKIHAPRPFFYTKSDWRYNRVSMFKSILWLKNIKYNSFDNSILKRSIWTIENDVFLISLSIL